MDEQQKQEFITESNMHCENLVPVYVFAAEDYCNKKAIGSSLKKLAVKDGVSRALICSGAAILGRINGVPKEKGSELVMKYIEEVRRTGLEIRKQNQQGESPQR